MDRDDVVLAVGINLKRNLRGIPFTLPGKAEMFVEMEDLLREYLDVNAEYKCTRENKTVDTLLDSKCFFASERESEGIDLRFSEDTRVVLGLNDHINLRAWASGGAWSRAYKHVKALEKDMSGYTDFAYDANWGYLTASVCDTGNGMRAAALVFLPGLDEMEQIDDVRDRFTKDGYEFVSLTNDEDVSGSFYALVSRRNLGGTDVDVLIDIQEQLAALSNMEFEARKEFVQTDFESFTDNTMRALGVLRYAVMMGYEELVELYSDIRMALIMGKLDGDIDALDKFIISMSPGEIDTLMPESSDREKDVYRASHVREIFNKVTETERTDG